MAYLVNLASMPKCLASSGARTTKASVMCTRFRNSCITFCLAACPSHVSRIHPVYVVQSTHILRLKNLHNAKHQIGKYSYTRKFHTDIQILYRSYMSIHVLISRCPERAQPETWDDLLSFSPELKSNPVISIVYLFVSALVAI